MPNVTRWIPQGLHAIQVSQRIANYLAGFGGLTLSDGGQSSNMRLLIGGVSAASPLPQSQRVYNRGRDGTIATRIFNGNPNDFNLGFEDFDGDLAAMMNVLDILTLGEWDFVPEGGPINFQNIAIMVTRHAISAEPDSEGTEGYENALYMSCSGRIEPGSADYQSPGAFTMTAQASPVQLTPFGTTVLAAHGQQSMYSWRWFSQYPTSVCTLIGDGVEDEITLGMTPISTAKTKAFDVTSGTQLTVSSVNTGTDKAALSAAPTDEHAVVCFYETTDI